MAPRSYDLKTIQPAWNPLGVRNKVRGGAIATRASRDEALHSQMRDVTHGRRIVCRAGLDGQASLLVLDGSNPNSGVTQIYPDGDAERVMARAQARLTPGYHLAVMALMLPSGPAQHFVGSSYIEDGTLPPAHVRIDVVYDNGVTTSSKSYKITPPASVETFKRLPTGAGNAWGVLETFSGSLIPDVMAGAEAGWMEHVTVTVTIVAVGACRPIDVVVHETPNMTQAVVHDDTHREATLSLTPTHIASAYPLTGMLPPTDDNLGSHQANKTMGDQRQIWGPTLMYWSCWSEDAATIADTEGAAVSFTTTAFRSLGDAAISSYATTNPGWSVSCGGYARNIEQSGALELRDVNGTIPVTVRVYCRMTAPGDSGTVRVQSATYAYRDIEVRTDAYAWHSALTWIRVPVHASLDSLLQVFGSVSGVGQTLQVRYVSVEYGGHYEVSE